MAIELRNPLTITEETKIYGHNTVDIDGVPTDAGNGNVGQIVDIVDTKYIQGIKADIDNIKAKINGEIYRTQLVDANAYQIDVPSHVFPYAEVQKLKGKSVVWNQLRNTYRNKTEYGITVSTNSDGTVSVKGTATSTPIYNQLTITDNIHFKRDGRKYYISSNVAISNNFGISGYGPQNKKAFIFSDTNNSDWSGNIFIFVSQGDVLDFSNLSFNVIDLTIMFGAGNEPTLKECNKIFSSANYPYDAGTIKSFPVQRVKSVGKNLCLAKDVYKGADKYLLTTIDGRECVRFTSGIRIQNNPTIFKANTQYTVSFDLKMVTKDSNGIFENVFSFFYTDGTYSELSYSKHNFIDWKRITFTSQENKTVLYIGLISQDYRTYCYVSNFQLEEGSVATAYSPYMESTIDLSSATADMKSAGTVADEWVNGKVVHKVGSRAYTSGDESDSSLMTDGTTTYYPLTTPTEETVPLTEQFIDVESKGTLTFISDESVQMPIESTTKFVVNLEEV